MVIKANKILDELDQEEEERAEAIYCEICHKEIKPEELQVWLQTKHYEFSDWRYLEDLKFHNSCWIGKMKSIRAKGQEDVKQLIEAGIVEAQKYFK